MGHLEDTIIQVTSGAKTFRVLVTFSCHCFTEEIKPHHTPDYHYVYGHERRAFCPVRHGLSHNLPNFIAGLSGKAVYLAGRNNYFIIRSNGGNYVVFFDVKTATNPKYDARIIVQSGHIRNPFIQYAKPVKFNDLVAGKAAGTPITPGKKQKIQRS